MRLVTFKYPDGRTSAGAWIDGDKRIVDLGAHDETLHSLQALIEGGDAALDKAREIVAAPNGAHVIDTSAVTLLAPLPQPVQMRDFLCFEKHLKQSFQSAKELQASFTEDPEATMAEFDASGRFEIPAVWYEIPIYYKCNRFAVIGTGQDILWPSYSMLLDYELELACVIGKTGKDISREEAASYIFGYTIFNDVSARDAQTREMQGMLGPAKGKDFDTSNILGPCIVTADEIGDPYELTMVARVNDEEWSRGSSSTMHHKFEDLIAYVSQSETLHPGEVFGSGTVGGGCGLEIKRFLSPDDRIELEIEKIGKIQNTIRKG